MPALRARRGGLVIRAWPMQGPTAGDESCSWHERLASDRTLPLGTQVVECVDYLGVIPRIAGWGLFGALPSAAFYPYHGPEMGASR